MACFTWCNRCGTRHSGAATILFKGLAETFCGLYGRVVDARLNRSPGQETRDAVMLCST